MSYGYGKKLLFDRMDLVLNPGGIFGLLGLNGAGKTSLLKLLAGALLPQHGGIHVFGRNPAYPVSATPLEKYLAALFEMVFLIPISAITLATACSVLLAGMENLAGGQGGSVWTFLDFSGRSDWVFFVVLTSFMLAGATILRRQVLLKPLVVLTAYWLVFGILVAVLHERISRQNVYPGGRSISFSIGMGNGNISYTAAPDWLLNIYINYFNIHFFILTPLCALVFAYFRVREKEAKDAVQ